MHLLLFISKMLLIYLRLDTIHNKLICQLYFWGYNMNNIKLKIILLIYKYEESYQITKKKDILPLDLRPKAFSVKKILL